MASPGEPPRQAAGEPPLWPPGASGLLLAAGITAGAGLFIVALVGSALFDPKIWVLHAVKVAIYLAVIVLAWRRSAWGLGAGFGIALQWNCASLWLWGDIGLALDHLRDLAGLGYRLGYRPHPVLLLVLVGAAGHWVMIACCLAAFLLLGPRRRRWRQFAGGAVLGICVLVLISPRRAWSEQKRMLDVTNSRIWSSLGEGSPSSSPAPPRSCARSSTASPWSTATAT